MNLHEYQAKQLVKRFGVPVPRGANVTSDGEALAVARDLGGSAWVVKAQVHAGARGEAGGVKFAYSLDEVGEIARDLLGARLVTAQTDGEGLPINSILIEEALDITNALYLRVLVDSAARRVSFVASPEGDTNVEEFVTATPEKALSVAVDPATGLQRFQCRQIGFGIGLDMTGVDKLTEIMMALYRLFMSADASLVEIHPLAVTGTGDMVALDAKINIDDNALYRQVDLSEWRDLTQEDSRESEAHDIGLNYVALDGDIGCMVNGAGLAMATMDIVKLHGGQPANFLDVGGGATAEQVANAFRLVLSGSNVKAILVNIFGGIVRCDLVAEGVIGAVSEAGLAIPIVVRLQGTNVEKARAMLVDSGLNICTADELTDAAKRVVAAVR